MEVTLHRLNQAYHIEATNQNERTIQMDASVDAGGGDLGMRPMQALLAALGACTEIDVIGILQKQRAHLQDIVLQVRGERAIDQIPAVFTAIHIHYAVTGELTPDQLKRAIDLSLDKYCSVTAMLRKTAHITYSYELNGVLAG
jgi:putative redox protein